MASYSILIFAFIVIINSCNISTYSAIRQVVIDMTIASGVQYTLNLKPYGNNALIIKQATFCTNSQLVTNPRLSTLLYPYSSSGKPAVADQLIPGVSAGKQHNDYNNNIESTLNKNNFNLK